MPLVVKKLEKDSILYLTIVVLMAIIVCIGFFYYRSLMPKPKPEIEKGALEELKEKKIIGQQSQELDELRIGVQPLTEKKIQKQLEELNKLR